MSEISIRPNLENEYLQIELSTYKNVIDVSKSEVGFKKSMIKAADKQFHCWEEVIFYI